MNIIWIDDDAMCLHIYIHIYIGQRLGVPQKAVEVHCVPVSKM